jgi:hypothetical protein
MVNLGKEGLADPIRRRNIVLARPKARIQRGKARREGRHVEREGT